jgi:hypothetical protein
MNYIFTEKKSDLYIPTEELLYGLSVLRRRLRAAIRPKNPNGYRMKQLQSEIREYKYALTRRGIRYRWSKYDSIEGRIK